MMVFKNFTPPPDPLGGVKGQIFNLVITQSVVNIYTDISHADRGTINMKHIKRDFLSKAYVSPPGWT